jgi:polyhydroxybutyrate depolymerase
MTPGIAGHTLQVGGLQRRFLVHTPREFDAVRRVPVVYVLHGAGGTAQWTLDETGWGAKADREGFILVLPEALPMDPSKRPKFFTNPQVWNDRAPLSVSLGVRHDDVAFLAALLGHVERHFAVDPRRAYVTGFSNGAAMTFLLATELSTRFAAIAPVAGRCRLEKLRPERPVPTLYLIGRDDPLVPLAGGDVKSPWTGQIEKKPPVRETLAKWAKAIRAEADAKLIEDREGVKVERHAPRKGGAELLVYTIEGLGHHWPGGKGRLSEKIGGKPSKIIKATDVIWEFFRWRPMP